MQRKARPSNSIQPNRSRNNGSQFFPELQVRSNTVPVEVTDQIERAEPAGATSDLHATEDAALVAAAKNGEATAFAMLVERYDRRIFSVVRRMTRNREDAEDIVQQSFQKAFVHLNSFVGRSSFSTWLTRIAINEALMLLRKNRGLREVLIDDLNGNEGAATALEIPDSSPDPEAVYSRREWRRMLSSAMNELPPGTRKAIQLRELDERSSKETARIMGITISALKGRMFHGRRRLRERLKRYAGSTLRSGRRASRTIVSTGHLSQGQFASNACD
jgi:RNA polymerase sigma-70 factor (ECF subfamily)